MALLSENQGCQQHAFDTIGKHQGLYLNRQICLPRWDGYIEELIKNLTGDVDSNFTWKDRVTWLYFTGGGILLLILLLG